MVVADLPAWSFGRTGVALEVDLAVYSVEAARRAAYKFTDRCYVFLASGGGTLVATLTPKIDGQDLDVLVGDFGNELLDQRLRESLEMQFGVVRDLIVAQAFAEGNLLDTDRDDGDYRSDPRGIGRQR